MTQLFALPAALAAGSYTPSMHTVPVTRRRRLARRPSPTADHWPGAIDQCLRIGLAQGRCGVREATDRVMAQHPAITRMQCWRRLRWLREHAVHARPDPAAWPAELLECLREGYRQGGAKKRAAFRAVRAHYPDLPGHVIVRIARRHGWLQNPSTVRAPSTRRRWTADERRRLSGMAEHHGVAYMAQALGRTPRAIRWRLSAQSLSAKVADAWSLHMLERSLHVGHHTLQRWIAEHNLRVRDARITGVSLLAYVLQVSFNAEELDETCSAKPLHDVRPEHAYRWKDAATWLGHHDTVRAAVARGELKLVDAKVSDRALEKFCRRYALQQLDCARIDPAVRRWLTSEYRLPSTSAGSAPIPRCSNRTHNDSGRSPVRRSLDEQSLHLGLVPIDGASLDMSSATTI